jgi:N-acetylneuraminic acid mutarotase
MKKFLTACCSLFILFAQAQITTSSQWTWMKGDNSTNQLGVYGTQGIADGANKPGSRQGTMSGTDASGNLWLFGGSGYDGINVTTGSLNDLWKYNTATNDWTWIKGDNIRNKLGIYGMQGTPNAANKPGGRSSAVAWKDGSGNLWLFGGNGFPAAGVSGSLNDLWKYNDITNEWTWVKGDNSKNKLGIYGIQGTADAANKPGGRESVISWADSSGNLWLFGGLGYPAIGGSGRLNDIWKYNTATNEWTWVNGDNSINHGGIYGTQGIADPVNKPGSRDRSVSWIDNIGNLWIFGGFGYDINGNIGDLNDLWKYDITANEWTWMKGEGDFTQGPYGYGVYGIQGTADTSNKPGSRENSLTWVDANGDFWLFGGTGLDGLGNGGRLNDLWKYNTAANEWTWVKGDNSRNQWGVYGTLGTTDAANKPGSRFSPVSWKDGGGNRWLFGGNGYDASGGLGRLNDMLKLSDALITLPLHLLEFNGRLQNGNAMLNWKTENEQNVSHFEMERSTDGRNYTAIANVAALNQPGVHNYNYTDNNISALTIPVVYYRLKQKDIDGGFTYSRIVALPVDNSKNLVLFYPNPAINEASLTITIAKQDKVQLRITDNTGRIIKQQQLNPPAGSTSLPVDVSGLTKGIYFLELKGQTVNERKQFVKL